MEKAELSKLKKTELVEKLKDMNLPTHGRKDELVERILDNQVEESADKAEEEESAEAMIYGDEEKDEEEVDAKSVTHETDEEDDNLISQVMERDEAELPTAGLPTPSRAKDVSVDEEHGDSEEEEGEADEGEKEMDVENKKGEGSGGKKAKKNESANKAIEEKRRVYLGRIPVASEAKTVKERLEPFGKILDFSLTRGFAFCEFETRESAEKAVQELDGADIDGGAIIAEFAKPKATKEKKKKEETSAESFKDKDVGRRVYIGNVARATEEQLRSLFEPCGQIASVMVKSSFAFIIFKEAEGAKKAVSDFNDSEINGNKVVVEMSKERESVVVRPRERRRERRRDQERAERRRSPPRRSRDPPPRFNDRVRSPERSRREVFDRRDERREPVRSDRYDDRRYDDRRVDARRVADRRYDEFRQDDRRQDRYDDRRYDDRRQDRYDDRRYDDRRQDRYDDRRYDNVRSDDVRRGGYESRRPERDDRREPRREEGYARREPSPVRRFDDRDRFSYRREERGGSNDYRDRLVVDPSRGANYSSGKRDYDEKRYGGARDGSYSRGGR